MCPHSLISPFPCSSSLILFRSLPPPNCRSHFLLLPLTCSQWSNVDVIVWVLELHLHPIRLKGGALCSNGRWESVWQWPLSAGIRRTEYCKPFQKRRESTNWWFSTWKSDPCTGLLIFQGCIVKPQIEHQNKENIWFKCLWTWYGWWSQMSWYFYRDFPACPENVKIFSGLRLYGPYDQQGAVRWEGPTALIWQEDNNNSNKHTTQPTYTE